MLTSKILYFKEIYKFATGHFFIEVTSFHLFIKNVFMKMKNSIYLTKYTRYGKNFNEKNSLFQRDLQICYWSFSHRKYVFCLIMKNVIKNKKFWFFKKLNEIRKKMLRTKLFISKRYTNLLQTIFLLDP